MRWCSSSKVMKHSPCPSKTTRASSTVQYQSRISSSRLVCRTTWANVGVAAMGNLSCREPWVPLVWLMAQLHRVVTAMTTVWRTSTGGRFGLQTNRPLASLGQSKGVRVAHWTSRLVGTPPHALRRATTSTTLRALALAAGLVGIRGVAVRCRGGRGCPGLRPPGPGAQRPASLNPGMIFAASWIQSFATGGAQRNPGDSGRMWLLSSARWTSSRETIHTTTRFSSHVAGAAAARTVIRNAERWGREDPELPLLLPPPMPLHWGVTTWRARGAPRIPICSTTPTRDPGCLEDVADRLGGTWFEVRHKPTCGLELLWQRPGDAAQDAGITLVRTGRS